MLGIGKFAGAIIGLFLIVSGFYMQQFGYSITLPNLPWFLQWLPNQFIGGALQNLGYWVEIVGIVIEIIVFISFLLPKGRSGRGAGVPIREPVETAGNAS